MKCTLLVNYVKCDVVLKSETFSISATIFNDKSSLQGTFHTKAVLN